MKRGPREKPTALKLIQGNPGHRPINKDEPKPEKLKRVVPAPSFLTQGAKNEWRRISKELHELGMLTRLDRAALAAYCVCYDRWVEAEKKVMAREITKTKAGNIIQNPYLSVANKARDDMRKFLIEFGMTPSSRTGISAPTNKPSSFDDV